MKKKPKRNAILFVVIVGSIILYLAGVFSGLAASKVIKAETQEDLDTLESKTQTELNSLKDQTQQEITSIKDETQRDINSLKVETTQDFAGLENYVSFLDENVKSSQLEQLFLSSLSQKERCDFSKISIQNQFDQLSYYWNRLPFRIEEYERENELSNDYLTLKKEYNLLSLQTWIIAKSSIAKCENNLILILYLYSKDCTTCVRQGEILDTFKEDQEEEGKDVMIFTVDADEDTPMMQNIKKFYQITQEPAIIINDQVIQGRLILKQELIQ